jgi:hypothetical protein
MRDEADFLISDLEDTIQLIRKAIEENQAIRFTYDDFDRVVNPYVLGLSSEGNPLMRGYQTEGVSVSGKGPGWRVYQVRKMVAVELYGEWFEPDRTEYDPYKTWIFEVDTQIT